MKVERIEESKKVGMANSIVIFRFATAAAKTLVGISYDPPADLSGVAP